MFHSRKCNYRINEIHTLALRILYHVHQCSFEELLERDKSAIEMFKVSNGFSEQLVREKCHVVENV